MFGLGCFWGAERKFWQIGDGIHVTAVGYAAGHHAQSNLRGGLLGQDGPQRGRAGGVRSEGRELRASAQDFWESHDPTQGMRQGNDAGTQYRSGIYAYSPAQRAAAEASKAAYGKAMAAKGYGAITTEIFDAPTVLLRRGLSSAVSRQEPGRLLRARRHGRCLPDRHWSGVARALSAVRSGSRVAPAMVLPARADRRAAASALRQNC